MCSSFLMSVIDPNTPERHPISCARMCALSFASNLQGTTAFLKRQTHEAAFGEGSSLLPGMLLEAAVVTPGGAAAGARTVTVSTDPNLVRRHQGIHATPTWGGGMGGCMLPLRGSSILLQHSSASVCHPTATLLRGKVNLSLFSHPSIVPPLTRDHSSFRYTTTHS